MAKAKQASEVIKFTEIPNIGPAMERDFVFLKIKSPKDLQNKDAFTLYTKLCKESGVQHDPCVLDTFIAAIDFMNGAPARPWFYYTKERKKKYSNI